MALENGGRAERIEEGSDASEQMTGFYDTISTPLLSDIEFHYPDTAYNIQLPTQTTLYQGSEMISLGRYVGEDGERPVRVTATSDGGSEEYKTTFALGGGRDNDFISRFEAT